MPKLIKRTLEEMIVVPDHEKRRESAEFRKSKVRLKKDGHFSCYLCGCTEGLEVHHYGAEWSLAKTVDFDRLKAFCEEWDVYGYGKLLKNQPITSVDDIRNCMVLCRTHHTSAGDDGVDNGIHFITFPVWISQGLARKGENPVPDDTADIEVHLKENSI